MIRNAAADTGAAGTGDAGMIQRTASMSRVYNLDLLIWRKNSPGSSLVRSFADYLQKYAGELAGEWGE